MFCHGQCLDWNMMLAYEFAANFTSDIILSVDEATFLEQVETFYDNFYAKYALRTKKNQKNYNSLQKILGLQGGQSYLQGGTYSCYGSKPHRVLFRGGNVFAVEFDQKMFLV